MINFNFGCVLLPISEMSPTDMLRWRNDPTIYKWCRQYEPLEAWTHQAWLESLAKRGDVKMYGVGAEIGGQSCEVGVCGLTSLDWVNRRAEFSLYIAPEFHGQGLGKRALKTLLAHAFHALGLHSVWGETFDGNPAAEMFEGLGFTKEGTRREFYFRDGKFIDVHNYAILDREFKTKWLPQSL